MVRRSRDIFGLSKSRLRENTKFRALTPSEKWFWLDLFLFLDDQDPAGLSRWPLDRISRALGAPIEVYRSLISQDILRGCHGGESCKPLIHKDRRGEEHTLIPAQLGPIWYSSAIVRDEYLRQVASKSGQRGGGNPLLKRGCDYTLIGAVKGEVKGAPKGVVKGVSGHPSPSPAPPLTLSSPNPTHTPKIPIAAQSASGDAAAGENPEKPRKKGERKLTDDQLETQKSLQEWWIKHAWPASHEGVEYPEFDGSDAAAVLRILKNKEINWDGTRARALLQLYLKQADIYGARGHRLREVGQHLSVYLPMLVRSEKGTVNHNGNGQQHNRASFVGARRSLPTLNGAEPQSVKNEG